MNDVQRKLAQLQEKGWTLAALADELGVTVNAVEKWKAGDRYPSNAKLVLTALDGLSKRRHIPKKRRYTKRRGAAMARNSRHPRVPARDNEALDPSIPLPLYVARLWGFPLQYHVVEGKEYFSIKDWIAGLTGSRRASHMWENYKDRHKEDVPPSRGMAYVAANGQTFTLDFTSDEGLYKITLALRVSKARPVLNAIKDFLAKAGVFVDEARRDPEGAAERLAIVRRTQALRAGKSEEWVATREHGVITRKQFVSQIYALVENKKQFGLIIGSLTNELYRGAFHDDVQGLRERLGISVKENPRDHFSRIALSYTTIAEEAVRIHLSQYNEQEFVPVSVIRQVVQDLSAAIGIQADTLAKALQLDIVTGQRVLPASTS
jgi:lambda repressor-like predicted transcriptional regulator